MTRAAMEATRQQDKRHLEGRVRAESTDHRIIELGHAVGLPRLHGRYLGGHEYGRFPRLPQRATLPCGALRGDHHHAARGTDLRRHL